jgi:hypothetical protein
MGMVGVPSPLLAASEASAGEHHFVGNCLRLRTVESTLDFHATADGSI